MHRGEGKRCPAPTAKRVRVPQAKAEEARSRAREVELERGRRAEQQPDGEEEAGGEDAEQGSPGAKGDVGPPPATPSSSPSTQLFPGSTPIGSRGMPFCLPVAWVIP